MGPLSTPVTPLGGLGQTIIWYLNKKGSRKYYTQLILSVHKALWTSSASANLLQNANRNTSMSVTLHT